MIPGVDGVGRLPDGRLVYFAAGDDVLGTMADKALVDPRRSVELPAGADVAKVAAAMNPAMSSWVALRRRVPLKPGQSVLILGATGNAGAMAVQVARRLGAGRVVGAGRDPERLRALLPAGADDVVQLTGDAGATGEALAAAAAEVDIVLDYLWGGPAQRAIMALLTARSDRGRALDWIQIGAVAGPTIELPSVALRSANFRLQGSGQGSVSPRGYLAELPALIGEISAGTIDGPGQRGTAGRRGAGLDQRGDSRRSAPSWCPSAVGPAQSSTAARATACAARHRQPRQAHRVAGAPQARRWRRAPRPPRRR